MKAAGVEVELVSGKFKKECEELNKRFFTFHTKHRPYIILKWAQTADGFIAPLNLPERGTLDSDSFDKHYSVRKTDSDKATSLLSDSQNPPSEGREASRLLISNEYSNRLVHKWRSEEASVLVGTNTALLDDPELTTRRWPGPSPVRLVVDMDLKLPSSLKLFNGPVRTIVFNTIKHKEDGNLMFYQVGREASLVHQVVNALYRLKIQSVLVEGGARLLQSFINEEIWDEARIITNEKMTVANGLPAPVIENRTPVETMSFQADKIEFYRS